jgi:proline dehydrogenase
MSLSRSLLLRASRSPWLADQVRRRTFTRRAVRRFMPGEDLASALDAAATLADSGIGTVLTNLGERVTSRSEADAVEQHYRDAATAVRDRKLPTHISVKLTHLGLDLDRAACVQRVDALATAATAAGSFLWIDMEESEYVDATLDVFRQVRATHPAVGICLQAYLHRTPGDLDALATLSPAIRLVKGAYREPASVAFPNKADVDAAYIALGERLLIQRSTGGPAPAFGTHDLRIIEQLRARAAALGVAAGGFEIHMLYGIKSAELRRFTGAGVTCRVLISYGTHWFPWYMRRLAERPANVWFVVRNLVP